MDAVYGHHPNILRSQARSPIGHCAWTSSIALNEDELALVGHADYRRAVRCQESLPDPLGIHLFRSMYSARCIDEAEHLLVKQGRAFFHVSGAGHEAMAAL